MVWYLLHTFNVYSILFFIFFSCLWCWIFHENSSCHEGLYVCVCVVTGIFFLAAEFLGFDDYIPSFASTVGGENILKGVNYASGGSGIRAETGQHAVMHIYATAIAAYSHRIVSKTWYIYIYIYIGFDGYQCDKLIDWSIDLSIDPS